MCIAFHMQPSEYDRLTLTEVEEFRKVGKKAGIFK